MEVRTGWTVDYVYSLNLFLVLADLRNVCTVGNIIHPSREYLRQQVGGWVMAHVLPPGGCHRGNNLQEHR